MDAGTGGRCLTLAVGGGAEGQPRTWRWRCGRLPQHSLLRGVLRVEDGHLVGRDEPDDGHHGDERLSPERLRNNHSLIVGIHELFHSENRGCPHPDTVSYLVSLLWIKWLNRL